MPNTSYLVRTPRKTLYPSACESNFTPETWTVAAGIHCVPLLWIAMFRPTDLVTQEIRTKGETVTARSVVTATSTGLEQLRHAVRFLDEIAGRDESLAPYSELLAQAISASEMPFVTIELDEIAALFPRDSFQTMLQLGLAGLQAEDTSVSFKVPDAELINPFTKEKFLLRGPEAEGLVSLLAILSGLGPQLEVNADDDGEASDEVLKSRLLGCSHFAPVPWEH